MRFGNIFALTMASLRNVQIVPSDLGVLRALVVAQQCRLAYHGRRECTSFTTSKSHDKTEHEEDKEESTLDNNIDESDINANQVA